MIKVLPADDHPLLPEGIAARLEASLLSPGKALTFLALIFAPAKLQLVP